jgi:hypothetical protein
MVDFWQPRGGQAELRFLLQWMKPLHEMVFSLVLAFGKPRRLVTLFCLKVQ